MARTVRRAGFTALAVLLAMMAMLIAAPAVGAQNTEDAAAVQGVFFFSPTCGHCEQVITEVLPGIFEEYGGTPDVLFDDTIPVEDVAFFEMTNGTFELLLVDATKQAGAALYQSDIDYQGIPENHWGVPRLTMSDGYWVGSVDIPEVLPQLIEEGLAQGGMPYPAIPGIEDALATIPDFGDPTDPDTTTTTSIGETSTTSDGTTTTTAVDPFVPAEDETWQDKFMNDPVGNTISVLILIGMAATLITIVVRLRSGVAWGTDGWAIPVLSLFGLAVASYLGIVEASGSDAVCGPVGDCNTVQQSEWAELFGIPIGIIGMAGYIGVLIAWAMAKLGSARVRDLGLIGMAGVAFGGTLFSMYLTFLEPFVIGATCMWCITSAITITLLAWLTASNGWMAAKHLRT